MFFLDWVNWTANLIWPVLKVSEVISTIGDLNAFDTNGVVLCTRHRHSLDLHGLHDLLSSPALHGLRQPVGSLLLNYDGKFPIHIAVYV